MKTNQIEENEYKDQFLKYFDEIEQVREQGLNELKRMQGMKHSIHEKEKARLEKKLGEDHPQVQEIEMKMRYDSGLDSELDVMIEDTQIRPPVFDEKSWRVQGRIVNQEGKGIQGLTVGLYDEKGDWIRELGYGCSDSHGFYHITVTQESGIAERYKSQKLFVTVSDKNYKILYRDQDSLTIEIGKIDYRHIMLDQEETICMAPKPGEKDTMLPKNIWMVKGSVADAEGRALGGVIVSLYDKDLLFDDKLGTTTTDEEGKYTLIYRTETFRDLIESNPDLYIKVFDRSGKRIGSYRRKIKFEAGRVEVINITIGGKKKKVKKKKGDSK